MSEIKTPKDALTILWEIKKEYEISRFTLKGLVQENEQSLKKTNEMIEKFKKILNDISEEK